MNVSRNNLGYVLAAAGGAVLVLSLFLAWASGYKDSASAWQIFSGIDILLALIGIAALGVALAHMRGAAAGLPRWAGDALKWLGVVAAAIVLTYLLETDNAAWGSFLAFLATLSIVAGAVFRERPELVDRLEAAAAERGVGTGDAGVASTPGAGAPGATSTAGGVGPAATPAGAGPGAGGAPGAAAPGPASSGAAATGPASTAGAGVGAGTGAAEAGGSVGAGAADAGAAGAGGGPPAGWYPDPQGESRLRYWDGAAWTDQTSV